MRSFGSQHGGDDLAVVLGNRGPKDGVATPESFTCDGLGRWAGVVVFGDGHVELFHDTAPIFKGRLKPDNLFDFDRPGEFDAFLAFTKEVVEGAPVFQFD